MLAMPTLLYRYILGDLLRVFVLTAAVLVTIIAFGATIKPLAGEGMMGVAETVKYLLLAIVPMLQFALPFAAGFASTLVLHRMTSDNEIMAAVASGMSYRRLLAPIVALGLLLTLIMVVLTQTVIPRFWGVMERTIAADITRVFEASIESGQPFQMGNLQIYADNMWVVANPSDTQADTRLILSRVAAAELTSDGRIATDVTANQAVVDIHRIGDQTYLKLILIDTVAFDGDPGQLARLPQIEPTQAIVVPSMLRDELRAMTRGQLLALRENPDTHSRVTDDRLELAEAMRSAAMWTSVNEHLATRGRITLQQAGPGNRRYVITADSVASGVFATRDDRPVEVRQLDGDTEVHHITGRTVTLSRTAGAAFMEPMFELELLDAEVRSMRGGTANRRERLTDHNLTLADFDVQDLSPFSSRDLLAAADDMSGSLAVVRAAGSLKSRLEKIDSEISARLLMRYAQSATALLLLTIGAVFALWLRGTVPLVIYIWSFLPSVLSLILISGGDKIVRDGEMLSGIAVMWSGNAALVLLMGIAYVRLRRN